MKWFRILFLIFMLTLVAIAVVMESNPGKKLLERTLLNAISASGLKVESVTGNLPYQVHFKNVDVAGAHFDDVDMQISVIYLIKKELYIKSLKASGFRLLEDQPTTSAASTPKPPLTVTVHSFDVQGEYNLHGSGKIRKSGAGYLDVKIRRPEFPDSVVKADASWNRNQVGDIKIDCETPTLKAFSPWIKTEQEGALTLHIKAEGSTKYFAGKLSGKFTNDQPWTFHTHFQKNPATNYHLDHLVVSNPNLNIEGSGDISQKYEIVRADGNVRVQLPQGVVVATVDAAQTSRGLHTQINWHSDTLDIHGYHITKAVGLVQGMYANQALIGKTSLKATWLEEEWTATSPIAFRLKDSLFLEDIHLQSELGTATGNLAVRIPEMDLVGKFTVQQADLRLLHRAAHSLPSLFWFDTTGFYADFSGKQVYYDSAYADQATFYRDPNELRLTIGNGQWKTLQVSSATFDFKQKDIAFSASGILREPFEIQANATVLDQSITLNSLTGSLTSEPITLNGPATFSWGDHTLHSTPFSLQIGDGSLFFTGDQTAKKTDATLLMKKIPLKIFSLNPKDLPVSGTVSVDSNIHEENGITAGEFKAKIDQGMMALGGSLDSLTLQGDLDAVYERGRLKVKSDLIVNQKPYLALDANVPMTVDLHDHTIQFLSDRKVEGALSLHGRMEEILDFINLGTHRIEGNIDCEMKLSGKMNRPRLKGTCVVTNGRYQNYFTGTDLTDMTGTLAGEGNQLVLQNLTAHDTHKGLITANGTMELSPQNSFPFQAEVDLNQLGILQLDLITATADGKISIKGDLKSAVASGTTVITECDVTVPSKVPRSFPDLKVVYKNGPNPLIIHKQRVITPYPLNLDLKVTAPKAIYINGRGLHSEWKGDFTIGGNYTNPAVVGNIELVQGEFLFSGKQFKLLNGSIALQGKAYEMPLIDISANTSEKGISITARIKGPINSPQITFQSSPPMPLSSIVSYLIFGKDLADVSGLQALQLAGTIASVAGEGPDILEMTRKSLGVDRLQIVMTPSSMDEGADTISLEVGKVIFPGFLVAIRQGAEDDSPNMRVEVDLTHGFTLGLESEQQPEQGKFSLNWNINY